MSLNVAHRGHLVTVSCPLPTGKVRNGGRVQAGRNQSGSRIHRAWLSHHFLTLLLSLLARPISPRHSRRRSRSTPDASHRTTCPIIPIR